MTELEYRSVWVDGEELGVVEGDSLGTIEATLPSVTLQEWMRSRVEFVLEHEGFQLARRMVGPKKAVSWLILLETPTGPQRVHIEQVTCAQCRTSVDIANPTIPDLYMVLPNEFDALDRAWAQPEVPCPKCGAKLPRRAIWAAEAKPRPTRVE